MCPKSSYPFYKVTYYIKWGTTSWTQSIDSRNVKMALATDTENVHYTVYTIFGVEGMQVLAVQGRVRDRAGPQTEAVPAVPRDHRPQLWRDHQGRGLPPAHRHQKGN
mgnify:CR=1 FL=1